MTDTSDTEVSVLGESFDSTAGLADTADIHGSDVASTPSDGFDATSDSFATESAPIEPLFEIDGTPITLDEARNGYLRQADYTRKTQELAERSRALNEAEAIAAALQQDPMGTIAALQEAFGINGQSAESDPFAEMDPDVARIAALEQKIAAQEQAATQAAIESELQNLHAQFGEFDDSALFAHAIKGGFPNLKAAYADLNFTTVQAQLEAIRSQQEQEQARLDAKRQAASVVHNGSTRSGASSPTAPEQFGSIREAFLAAKKALGA